MKATSSIYRYIAFHTNQNHQRVRFCLHVTRMASTFDSAQPQRSKIEDVFEGLRHNEKRTFLLDGGTGEELFRRGVPDDRKIWSATAVVHPQYHSILEEVHTSFLQSGSNAITTNSYGVVPGVGFDEDQISEYIDQSGKIARSATRNYNVHSTSPAFVFGSLGPLVESYRPDKIMSHDEGVKCYKLICRSLAPYADAFIAETMSCVEESIQVLDAVASSPDVESAPGRQHHYLLISYSVDSDGNFRDGEKITNGIRRILDEAKKKSGQVQILAILFNCSEPEAINEALKKISIDSDLVNELKSSKIVLGAYAHKLTPIDSDWTLAESEAPQPFRNELSEEKYWKDFVEIWINEYGVRVVGGCCGISPEYICYIKAKIDEIGE